MTGEMLTHSWRRHFCYYVDWVKRLDDVKLLSKNEQVYIISFFLFMPFLDLFSKASFHGPRLVFPRLSLNDRV